MNWSKLQLILHKKRREIGAALSLLSLPLVICTMVFSDKYGKDGGTFYSVAIPAGWCLIGSLWFVLITAVRKLTSSEYDLLEESFESRSEQMIIDSFGQSAFNKLMYDGESFIPMHAIEACGKMLQSQKAEINRDLRFHILMRLARYYARDGQPLKAVETLEAALTIRPHSALANARFAERFEMTGKGSEAIARYELAQKDGSISAGLKNYFAEQIKRVQTEGPRKSGPFDGSGMWWMWGA